MLTIQAKQIDRAIERLSKFKGGIDAAVRRAIAPERWKADLEQEAERVLLMQAGVDLGWAVPRFLDMIRALLLNGHSVFSMSAPPTLDVSNLEGATNIGRETAPRTSWSGVGPMQTEYGAPVLLPPGRQTIQGRQVDLMDMMPLAQAQEMIRRWVEAGATGDEEGKEFDESRGDLEAYGKRGLYDNELVERIWHIFGIHPGDIGQAGISPRQEEAIAALTPHIVAFMQTENGNGIPPETASIWLRAVLTVWTEHFKVHLPFVLQEEIKTLTG